MCGTSEEKRLLPLEGESHLEWQPDLSDVGQRLDDSYIEFCLAERYILVLVHLQRRHFSVSQ